MNPSIIFVTSPAAGSCHLVGVVLVSVSERCYLEGLLELASGDPPLIIEFGGVWFGESKKVAEYDSGAGD